MKFKGGVSLVSRPPAFSPDGTQLLVCTGCVVSVFSVATGLLVNELEGHEGIVTSVNVVNYAGAAKSVVSHVWTSSLDKTVRFWDYTTGQLIKTVFVGDPIHSMVIPKPSNPESTVVYKQGFGLLLVQRNKGFHSDNKDDKLNGKKNGESRRMNSSNRVDAPKFLVVLYNLNTGKLVRGSLAEISEPQPLVSSPLGGLVGISDKRKLWVWRVSKKGIDNLSSFKVTILHHTKSLQALAFDPTETLVAGSDNEGRVLIWKNVGDLSYGSPVQGGEENAEQKQKNGAGFDPNRGVRGNDDAAAMTTYHWHASQVNFLSFSLDGAYLFSGGKEAVFVMWQLETGKQRFLPRLGSYLLHCAASPSDASVFCVACADNTIKLLNIGTMAVQGCIQGIKPPVLLPWRIKTSDLRRVALLPEAGNLVLPAEDLSLQFYDVVHDRQIGEVQVSQHNYTPSIEKGRSGSEKEQKVGAMVTITHIVFSRGGSVMATAECRQGEDGIGRGACLKFWNKNLAKLGFSMSTQIDDPHGSVEVSALVYHPFSDLAVSCSNAGEFKVWLQDEGRDRSVSFPAWRCRSVGSYRHKAMLSADISSDGSLLAVAAEEAVTLWNLSTNGLVHVLSRNTAEPINILRFIPSTKFLVVASCGGEVPEFSVWNLETLSVCWSYHVTVKAIAVDAMCPHIAVLGTSEKWSKKKGQQGSPGFVAVFDSNSPVPRAIWSAQDVDGSNIFWLSLGGLSEDHEAQESKTSRLLYLSKHREYSVFNPFVQEESPEAAPKKKVKPVKKEGLSAFASVYGKASNPHIHSSDTATRTIGAQPRGKLFDCPSHLIYLDKIGFSYIESLMERRVLTSTFNGDKGG